MIKKYKPNGYWKDIRNVRKAIRPLSKRLGRFPRSRELNKYCPGLANALVRYYGGLQGAAQRLGCTISLKRETYLKNFDNVSKRIREVMKKKRISRIPTQVDLVKMGEGSLVHAIFRYHGGFWRRTIDR